MSTLSGKGQEADVGEGVPPVVSRHAGRGDAVTTKSQGLSDSAAVSIYRRMATIRTAEDRLIRGLSGGEFSFSYYPVRGHEAISATLGEVLRPDDQLSSTYRCFADIVAKGTPLTEIFAEQMGRETGTSKGK